MPSALATTMTDLRLTECRSIKRREGKPTFLRAGARGSSGAIELHLSCLNGKSEEAG
jgi:hypothetical protein